jgi:hypothetical protein
MPGVPEYDRFLRFAALSSPALVHHAEKSWEGIDFNMTEPDIIRRYLLSSGVGVDYLNANVSPLLTGGGFIVKFASVFVHQKPRITRHPTMVATCPGDTIACELGDLLVIFSLIDKNKVPLFRSAMISQAKKDPVLGSQSQKCLYDWDTVFDMPDRVVNHSIRNHPERYLPDYSSKRAMALNYLILQRNYPYVQYVPWASWVVCNWGLHLCRMIFGETGLPFTKAIATNPDWNCIMHDLLNVGRGIVPGSIPRGSHLEDLVDVFNDFADYSKYSIEVQDNAGIPILFIIAQDLGAEANIG